MSATMAGAAHGLALLWVVAPAAFLKGVLNEGDLVVIPWSYVMFTYVTSSEDR